jgi:hypothetical protein
MDRRRFLATLAAAAAGAVLDPERLLWVPGRKVIVCFPGTITLTKATAATITLPPPMLTPEMVRAITASMKGLFSAEALVKADAFMRLPLPRTEPFWNA